MELVLFFHKLTTLDKFRIRNCFTDCETASSGLTMVKQIIDPKKSKEMRATV